MAYAGAILACVLFVVVARALHLFGKPGAAYRVSMRALKDLQNASLDDDAKERLMQQHALALGGSFLQIAGGAVVALAVPTAVLWMLDRADVLSLSATLATLASWRFLVGATVVFAGVHMIRRRMRVGQ